MATAVAEEAADRAAWVAGEAVRSVEGRRGLGVPFFFLGACGTETANAYLYAMR